MTTFLLLFNITTVYSICNKFKNLSIFFITFFALIIFNSELLSLFNSFNQLNIFILSSIEFLISLIYLLKTYENNNKNNSPFYFPNLKFELIKIKNSFKLDKSLLFLFLTLLFTLSCFLFLSFLSLPLEPDSRMYHFVRIFDYIKQQNFNHFLTNQIRNIIMPINSEIIYSYFYLFKKNDIGYGFLSFFSYIQSLFFIYLILKQLKISIRKRLFTIITLSSMGAILVQIPSLQTDIVVSNLLLSTIYLFILNTKSTLFFSSLSLALAIGTKTTALIALPSIFLILISYLLIFKKPLKQLILFIPFLILNFLIFSSYNYILNFLDFHNFISPESLEAEHAIVNGIKERIFNLIYVGVDFFGYHKGFLFHIVENFKNSLLNLLNIEDYSLFSYENNKYDDRVIGFTHLGIFFVFCLILSFVKTFKNKTTKIIAIISSTFLINYVLISNLIIYYPYTSRFFVTFVMISCFCLIYGYKNKFIRTIVFFFCFLNLFFNALMSTRCPIYCYFGLNIFDKTQLKQEIILNKQTDNDIKQELYLLNFTLENISKESKNALVDDSFFYEIKQLKNFGYNIDYINLEDLKDFSKLSKYDYIFIKDLAQFNDNMRLNNLDKDKNFDCNSLYKKIKNKNIKYAQMCFLTVNLFEKNGFICIKSFKIDKKTAYIFKRK